MPTYGPVLNASQAKVPTSASASAPGGDFERVSI